MTSVCILDYGSGNVRSVYNLFALMHPNVKLSNNLSDIHEATHIVLPGVGSFGASMRKIEQMLPMEEIKKSLFEENKPFLGICVGMQVMAEFGFEFGKQQGLGWLNGNVEKLNAGVLPLPHVGWNSVALKKASPLMAGFEDNTDFYFVHSYCLSPANQEEIVGTSSYGSEFCTVVEKNNLFGVQFHPEKSQDAGRKLFQNFLEISF